MFETMQYSGDKAKAYEFLIKQLKALSEGEADHTALLSNAAALLNQFLQDINWVGFYIWKDTELVLGPFQGLPACIRIEYGKGVCGTAVKEKQTQLVANVHEFPGHIACDTASNSEIVVPMFTTNGIYSVLDIDSPVFDRFNQTDKKYLEHYVRTLENYLD